MIKNKTQQKERNSKRNIVLSIIFILLIILTAFILHQSCSCSPLEIPTDKPVYLEENGESLEGEAVARDRQEILDELVM